MRYLPLILLFLSIASEVTAYDRRLKIAMIDTGVNIDRYPEIRKYLCKEGHKDFTGADPFLDNINHGSMVAHLLTDNLDESRYCLIVVKWFNTNLDTNRELTYIRALTYVSKLKVSYLNLSLNSYMFDMAEERLLKFMVEKKVKIATAAGNEGLKVDCSFIQAYPMCYNLDKKLFKSVSYSQDIYDRVSKTFVTFRGNYGVKVDYVDPVFMGGSSFNTPKYLNGWIRRDATLRNR